MKYKVGDKLDNKIYITIEQLKVVITYHINKQI